MSYFINPVEEEQCVFLSYEGEMPAREMSAARYEASGVLNGRQWNRIVVDLTALRSILTKAQLFDFAIGLSSGTPAEARVALVVRPEQKRHVNLLQKVARNKGLRLTSFLDPDRATLWVEQSGDRRQNLVHKRKETL